MGVLALIAFLYRIHIQITEHKALQRRDLTEFASTNSSVTCSLLVGIVKWSNGKHGGLIAFTAIISKVVTYDEMLFFMQMFA